MGLQRGFVALVLGAALAAGGAAVTQPRPLSQDSLEGDWEMFMASPRRPWIFLVHLETAAPGWTGTLSMRGLPPLPLRDIRFDSGQVHFELPADLHALPFDGILAGSSITGQVADGGQPTPTRLTRVVPLPAPANRVEAWRQDLEYLSERLSDYDRSFTTGARRDLRAALARLKLELPRRNDAEVLVAVSRAVALGGNAHTRLRLDPTRQGSFVTTFPIRLWWFSDGPYVIRAAPGYRRALRCRVVAIDGHGLSEAREKVTGLFAGNAAWADYLSPLYLTSPDILYGLGLIRSAREASFTFEDSDRSRFTLPVLSEPLPRDAMADESWQELSPLVATGRPHWETALAGDPAGLPLYLRQPGQPYWFEFLPDTGTLYFQFNHSGDAAKGPTFEEFGDSLLEFAGRHPVRDVVVDLRLNSGGNLDIAKGFIQNLAGDARINRKDRLFVIVGRCTFSAGLYHAAQLKQLTHAIFVGERAGDHLDFWAEGGDIVLPNSQAVIHYSNGFHKYSSGDYPQHRPYYEELSIRDLAPDIGATLSSQDYFSGRDPALEAIRSHEAPTPR